MNLKKEQINLLDGIQTKDFGYVRFFTVSDLLSIGESRYEKYMSLYAQNIELYESLPENIKMFDLIIARFKDGSRLSFSDEEHMIDVFLESLCVIYSIPFELAEKCILVDEISQQIIINGDYVINRDNYDSFCGIILKSNMITRMEKEEELKFKNKETEEKYKKRMEDFLKHAKKDIEKNKNSILTIANLMMARLKLYGDKKTLLSMTIHNLLFAYMAENEEEGYEKKYKQYLAGCDPKKLDLRHWQEKVKEIIK